MKNFNTTELFTSTITDPIPADGLGWPRDVIMHAERAVVLSDDLTTVIGRSTEGAVLIVKDHNEETVERLRLPYEEVAWLYEAFGDFLATYRHHDGAEDYLKAVS